MDIEIWKEAALEDNRGQVFLDNLRLDINAANLDHGSLVAFCEEVKRLPAKIEPGKKSYVEVGEQAVQNRGLFLRGQRVQDVGDPNGVLGTDMLLTLIQIDEFSVDILFEKSLCRRFTKRSPQPVDYIEAHLAAGQPRSDRRAGPHLRGGRPMKWLAAPSCLVTDSGNVCTVEDIREILGLMGYGSDEWLCVLSVPLTAVAHDVRKPNAFDGGLNMIFRSNPVAAEPYGRAINLKNYENEYIEVVSGPIDFTQVGEVLLHGQLSSRSSVAFAELTKTVDLPKTRTFIETVIGSLAP
ncbi:MAG: hypothetical protein NVV72_10825 [Asticcacaulis sp.]|nr:hypothetical protein [Asticcacaulis sp.]